MNTYIISSKNQEKALDEVKSINDNYNINKFDIEILTFEKQLSIDDVRQVQKKVFLKPFKGDKKSITLLLTSGAGREAQNSMLKLLEEPPASTLIFLIAEDSKIFIPTVLSRAKIINLKEKKEINNKVIEQITNLEGIGDSLNLAQNLSKDKNKAIDWLEDAILSTREKMVENIEDKDEALRLRKQIHNLEIAHYDLKNTNTNARLALEHLFLNI